MTRHVAGDADSQAVTHAWGQPESTRSTVGDGLLIEERDAACTAVAEDVKVCRPVSAPEELDMGDWVRGAGDLDLGLALLGVALWLAKARRTPKAR